MEPIIRPESINALSRPPKPELSLVPRQPEPEPIQAAVQAEESQPTTTWWSRFKDGFKKVWKTAKSVIETAARFLASAAAFLNAYNRFSDCRNNFNSQKQRGASWAI